MDQGERRLVAGRDGRDDGRACSTAGPTRTSGRSPSPPRAATVRSWPSPGPTCAATTSSSTRSPGTTWSTTPTASSSPGSRPPPSSGPRRGIAGSGPVVRSRRVARLGARPPRGPAGRRPRHGAGRQDVGPARAAGARRRPARPHGPPAGGPLGGGRGAHPPQHPAVEGRAVAPGAGGSRRRREGRRRLPPGRRAGDGRRARGGAGRRGRLPSPRCRRRPRRRRAVRVGAVGAPRRAAAGGQR